MKYLIRVKLIPWKMFVFKLGATDDLHLITRSDLTQVGCSEWVAVACYLSWLTLERVELRVQTVSNRGGRGLCISRWPETNERLGGQPSAMRCFNKSLLVFQSPLPLTADGYSCSSLTQQVRQSPKIICNYLSVSDHVAIIIRAKIRVLQAEATLKERIPKNFCMGFLGLKFWITIRVENKNNYNDNQVETSKAEKLLSSSHST